MLILLILSFITACSDTPLEKGTLTGKVTIGPLCPAEPCEMTPEQIEFAYSERRIILHPASDTIILAGEIEVHYNKPYSIDLLPGTYIVDINYIGRDRSDNVPARVTIRPGETDTLNIDIDTDIR